MSDAYEHVSREIDLARERIVEHGLAPFIPALRRFRTRSELLRSSLYHRLRTEIGEVTFATAHQRFAPQPPPHTDMLRVVAWNVERGRRLDRLLAFVQDDPVVSTADVLVLSEVDIGMARSGNVNVAEEIARTLELDYVFGACYLCLVGGNARDGHGFGDNRVGLHGNAILSRFPIVRAESFSVPLTHDIFESREKRLGHRKALWARLATPGGPLTVLGVHLDAEGSPGQRGRQLERALTKLEARGVADTVLVGGDFNTTTYDTASPLRLLANLARKLGRGGFPHAMHHYLHPYEHYELPVFRALEGHGYRWRELNELGVGTLRFEVGDPHTESVVEEHLPRIGVPVLRYKLRPWNGIAELKLDWFAGRNVRVLGDGEIQSACGRVSRAPSTLHRTTWNGERISDHDPIAIDVALPT